MFRVTYDVENKQSEVDFFWKGTITGDANGTVTFSMDGEARSTFRRNRIGFCVLHPMGCAGVPCLIVKVDGAVEESAYPNLPLPLNYLIDGEIKPVAPFNNMRAVRYEITSGVEAEVRFEGETFEMEDQRNWTDASYKTYGTPLSQPFPVEVAAGTKIAQRITLALKTGGRAKHREARSKGSTTHLGNLIRRPPTAPPNWIERCLSRGAAHGARVGTPQATQPFASACGC